MPVSPEELFAFLDTLGITHQTVEHEPVYTVNDGAAWRDKVAGLLKFLNALGYEPVTMDCGSGADALSNTGS